MQSLIRENIRMRRLLIGVAVTAAAVVITTVAAVGIDFGTSVYAEYRLSCAVRRAADLRSDPFVAILGFPFIPQAMNNHYDELEIKANAVDHAVLGKATLEATMHSIDLTDASWLIRPDAKLPVGKLESRIIIDSMHLGRYLGISHGLVFTGTPKSANFDKRVSVSVDLSIAGADRATLVLTPVGILTGPDTANQKVPDDKRGAVLAAFRRQLPDQRLPFGVGPTSEGARGSDVIIEGITEGVTIALDEFKQS
jgi:hypothetical protein